MASVDDRIVHMEFDNRSFEQRIGTTMSSLDKLKQKLNFGDSARGLSELQAAGRNFSLDGIGTAVENISSKFSAMGAVAFSVISNITNRAVDAGLRIGKALSIGPLLEGFNEYETNMNSIQTILANTKSDGTNLQQVNAALEELNQYSDKTIYNFSEMARNIGTFTAAGVNLDDSTNAIKGIANLAAISGSNSQQASTAMYQLSQALAAGKVNLMDWNSVVNAGMGGEIFKKALFETGKAMKTITDVPLGASFEEWEKKGGTFREQMEKGWLTADVLKTTLGAFSGELDVATLKTMGFTDAQAANMIELGKTGIAAATEVKTLRQLMSTVKESIGSGWSQTFKIIVGDFEEAKQLFTGLNNAIGGFVGRMSDSRNELLQGWKDLGGREQLITAFEKAFSAVAKVLSTVGQAFREIFPPMTAERLEGLTFLLVEFFEALKPSYETLDKLKRIFAGVFAALEIGWHIVKNVAGVFKELILVLTGALGGGSGILEFFAKMGDNLVNLNKVLLEGGGLFRFFDAIKNFLQSLQGGVGNIDGISDAAGRLTDRFGFLGGIVEWLGDVFGGLIDRFDSIRNAVEKAFGYITEMFGNMGSAIANAMKTGNFDEVFDVINTGLIGGILLILRNFMKNGFKGFGGGFLEKLSGIFQNLTGVLEAMQMKLKAEALQKIAIAIGVVTASLVVLSMIDSAALTKALTAMAVGFGMLAGVLALFNTKVFNATTAGKMITLSTGMIAISSAILILSAALKVISTLDLVEIGKGLLGVAGLLAMLIATSKLMQPGSLISMGIGLTAVAVAVNLLAIAVKTFSMMDWGEMAQGLVGVGIALGLLAAASHLINPVGMLAAGAGMIGLAVGLNILAGAIALMGSMDIGTLVQGLIGVGAALLIIAGAMTLMPATLPLTGAGLVLVGIGLNAVATALKIVGSMDWSEMGKGLVGIAAALTILAIAMNAMTGSLAGAAAIMIASTALVVLYGVINKMAKMSWGDIIKGLAGIAASLAVLGIAAALITPSIPSLLGLGAALILVGAGFALFGIGAAGVANALKLIADTGSVAIDALIALFDAVIKKLPELAISLADGLINIASKLLTALPGLLSKLGQILVSLFKALQEAIPELAETFRIIILQILETVQTLFPKFVETGFKLLLELLRGIKENVSQIVDTAVDIVLLIIATLTSRALELVTAGLNLLEQILLGIANNIQKIIDAGFQIVEKIIEGMTNGFFMIVDAVFTFITDLITNLGNGSQRIIDAGTEAIKSFLTNFSGNIAEIATAMGDFIVDVINGIERAIDENDGAIRAAAAGLAITFMDALALGLPKKIFSGLADTFGNKVEAGGPKDPLANKSKNAGKTAAKWFEHGFKKQAEINSPSKMMLRLGSYLGDGLALGVSGNKAPDRAIDTVSTNIYNRLNRLFTEIANAFAELEKIEPVITPVLDMTRVQDQFGSFINGVEFGTDSGEIYFSRLLDRAKQIGDMMQTTRNPNAPIKWGDPNWIDPTDENHRLLDRAAAEIKFEQNIFSPTPLSPASVYRNTKTQLAMAKEALKA